MTLVKPKILTAAALGLHFVDVGFGALGPERHFTGHYSATPQVATLEQAIAKVREFHRFHKGQGWGGLGYHVVFFKDAILLGRPTAMKGAHTRLHNSQNLGGMMIGTLGDKPRRAEMRALRWYLANAHTGAMPRSHRTDRDLRRCVKENGDPGYMVHKEWTDQATQCPDKYARCYHTGGRRRG